MSAVESVLRVAAVNAVELPAIEPVTRGTRARRIVAVALGVTAVVYAWAWLPGTPVVLSMIGLAYVSLALRR